MDGEPYIVAGTGSRSFMPTGPVTTALHRYVQEQQVAHPDLELMSGMAEGWDEFIARTGIEMGVPFHAAVPNRGYGLYYWGRHSQTGQDRLDQFEWLLSKAKTVTYVCPSLYVDGVHANFVRNGYLVAHGNSFAVYNPQSRGTAECFTRIKQARKPYAIFAPDGTVITGTAADKDVPGLFG
jgi:hypothetical protein